MKDLLLNFAAFGVGASLISMALWTLGRMARRREERDWNGGVAPDGSHWRLFDHDSQGGRGYKSSSGQVIWISYRGVDVARQERHVH